MWMSLAQERDVAAGADLQVEIGHRGGAREMRIDVDELGTTLFGFEHARKRDGMRFSHVGAHDDDCIRIHEILRERRRAAPAEGGAQTGHRAAMSYPRLVFDRDDSQAAA
jgi:hypothetical protein